MVLEAILAPEKAESKPWILIFLGFFYTSIAMALSWWIFKEYSSLFTVFLASIASIPIIYRLMKLEEQKDLQDVDEKFLLKEHYKALKAFMTLFIGAVLAFSFWYVILPQTTVYVLYESQTSTISNINGQSVTPFEVKSSDASNIPTGQVTGLTSETSDDKITGYSISKFDAFKRIFFNNVKVMIFCILFSFLYGAGAIFILLWNASVIGVAIGNFIRTGLSTVAMQLGSVSLGHYFSIVSIGLLKYVIHGIPEILAYFVAALAGGIISIAIINHEYSSQKFEHIILDSADLLMLAIAILFVAGLLEVYVTPAVFG